MFALRAAVTLGVCFCTSAAVVPPLPDGAGGHASTTPLRVAVRSPQPVVTAGLATMLAAYPGRVEVVPLHRDQGEPEPDVVLYDALVLLDDDATELARPVERACSRVLVVDRELRPDLAARALALGAHGFFSLGVDEKELLAAVESAGTGWHPGDSGENPIVGSSDSEVQARQLGAEAGLSTREVDILRMVARGHTNQEIADRLYLSINSVKTYVRTAYRKIGVRSRPRAVVWALQHGFDTRPER